MPAKCSANQKNNLFARNSLLLFDYIFEKNSNSSAIQSRFNSFSTTASITATNLSFEIEWSQIFAKWAPRSFFHFGPSLYSTWSLWLRQHFPMQFNDVNEGDFITQFFTRKNKPAAFMLVALRVTSFSDRTFPFFVFGQTILITLSFYGPFRGVFFHLLLLFARTIDRFLRSVRQAAYDATSN